MGVLRGGGAAPLQTVQEIFAASTSAVDSDCSRTAPGHCYGSTQLLQQRQVSKPLPTADHPRNAVRKDVRRLQVAANAYRFITIDKGQIFFTEGIFTDKGLTDVHPFYHDEGSTLFD